LLPVTCYYSKMSGEVKPGAGYESLGEVPRAFVDYVSSHARQGVYAQREAGPNQGGVYLYDVDLSENPQVIPFDHVFFEDNQGERRTSSGSYLDQRDQVTFLLGDVPLMNIYHEYNDRPDDGHNTFLLWAGKNSMKNPDETIVAGVLQQLGKLEQAGKMVPNSEPYRLPKAN